MNLRKIFGCRSSVLLASLLMGWSILSAADDATQIQNDQIAALKAALAAQQKQLEALQKTMEQQQKLLEGALNPQQTQRPNLGNVASLSPIVPGPSPAAVAIPSLASPTPSPQNANPRSTSNPCEAGFEGNTVPPYLRLGNVCIVPVGFMDATTVWRDKNAGSSMGSNFGGVPFNNAVNGNLSEFRFSPQNSRLGLRVDGNWKGAHFIGYNEFDFNGTSGSSTSATVATDLSRRVRSSNRCENKPRCSSPGAESPNSGAIMR